MYPLAITMPIFLRNFLSFLPSAATFGRGPMMAILPLAVLVGTGGPVVADGDQLRVLVWNVWRGGNEVDRGPEKIQAIIRSARPDLVLLQESYDVDGERPTLGR